MRRTEDAGEADAPIDDRLAADRDRGHGQNDLCLDMGDENQTGGVDGHEPSAPQAWNRTEPQQDDAEELENVYQKADHDNLRHSRPDRPHDMA